jgi:hypothetical protein
MEGRHWCWWGLSLDVGEVGSGVGGGDGLDEGDGRCGR